MFHLLPLELQEKIFIYSIGLCMYERMGNVFYELKNNLIFLTNTAIQGNKYAFDSNIQYIHVTRSSPATHSSDSDYDSLYSSSDEITMSNFGAIAF